MGNSSVYEGQELALSVDNIEHDLAGNVYNLKDLTFFGFVVRLLFNLNV